jgi:hypothetical protein
MIRVVLEGEPMNDWLLLSNELWICYRGRKLQSEYVDAIIVLPNVDAIDYSYESPSNGTVRCLPKGEAYNISVKCSYNTTLNVSCPGDTRERVFYQVSNTWRHSTALYGAVDSTCHWCLQFLSVHLRSTSPCAGRGMESNSVSIPVVL